MKLIIFDLDQTLVNFIGLHDATTRELFKTAFGVDARLTEIDFAGKSLTENFVALARLKRVPEREVEERSRQLLESYERIFIEGMPEDPSSYILPGVPGLLKELSKTGHLLVLYTGESPKIMKKVLEATALDKYFRFCLAGTEVETRADMVRQALVEAERLTGKRFSGKDIVIVGDSVRDIECGKEFGALTIAVATGFHTAEVLAKEEPDYIFRDLTDCEAFLVIVSGYAIRII